MFGLTPYNRRNSILRNDDFADFYNMAESFFNNSFPFKSGFSTSFKLDVREDEKAYLIDAELPGLTKDDIKLELNESELTISVAKEENINEEKSNYIHRERKFSSMQRTISLPNISEEDISAKYENGILQICVPKTNKSEKRKEIKIDSN